MQCAAVSSAGCVSLCVCLSPLPHTGESLWDLPERLKVALHDEDEESLRLIDETPRELLHDGDNQSDAASPSPDRRANAEPIRVVSAEFMLNVEMDPKIIVTGIAEVRCSSSCDAIRCDAMRWPHSLTHSLILFSSSTQLSQEARALAQLAMETALDVSAVIHKHRGNLTADSNIAKILGDKVHTRPHPKAGSGSHSSDGSGSGTGTMRVGGKKKNMDMTLLLDPQPQEFGEDFHRGTATETDRSPCRAVLCCAVHYCCSLTVLCLSLSLQSWRP